MSGELHGEVTCESIGRLHNDGLCPVRCQMSQHLSEAGTLIDWIGTAHCCIVVLAHQGEARMLGKGLDGCSLPLVAVLVSADIGRA